MSNDNLVSGHHKITGASFSLHPMSDNFIEVIEAALSETDTSNVWMKTDDVTTLARGTTAHVFDVTKAICVYAAKTGKHVAYQATYSVGCPGDSETDVYAVRDDAPLNQLKDGDQQLYAAAKFSLYPLGGNANFGETINAQIELMEKYVKVTRAPYATKLEGGLIDIFNGLEDAFQKTVDAGANHTVMTVTISMNSPSHK